MDRYEIQQLINRYHQLGSLGDFDGMVATFTPDAVWAFTQSGREIVGQAAIHEAALAFTSPLEYVAQINAPALIVVEGDRATASSSIRESGKFAGRAEGIEAFGIYRDELVRTADGWRFARREFETRWMHRVQLVGD